MCCRHGRQGGREGGTGRDDKDARRARGPRTRLDHRSPHVLSTAIELAARIAANAPGAVAATRRLMWLTATDGAVAGPAALPRGGVPAPPRVVWLPATAGAAAAPAALHEQPPSEMREREAGEGLASFLEKRAPDWHLDADGA